MSKPRETSGERHGSLARTTFQGVLWMTAGRFMKAPTNLIAVAILARLLTPADFGVVAIGLVVAGLATIIVDGTFGMVLVQKPKIDPAMIGASLLLSASLGALFGLALVAGGPLVQLYFGFPQLSLVLTALATVLPISAAMAVTTGLLQRASRFGALTVNSFLAQLVYSIVAVVLAFAGFGLWSLVWAQITQVCVETFLGLVAVRPYYRIALSTAALRETFRSGGMFTISKLFNWAAGNVDNLVVGRMLGPTALGLYSRPRTLMRTINQVIGTGTARVLFSSFARMQHDHVRMRRAFDRTLSTALIAATTAGAFVILFADLIVRVLLGPKWLAAVPVMQVLFTSFLTRSGYVVAEAVPLALGLGRASAYRQAAQFFLVIAGAWIGSGWGVVGAAAGIAAGYWAFYLLSLMLVHQLLDVGIARLFRIHLKGVIVAAVPALVTLALRMEFNPHGRTFVEMALAVLFAIVSVLVIAFGPGALLSEDIVTARKHVLQFTRKLLRLIGGRN